MSGPVTRQEQILSAISTGGDIISPITREEMYLAYLAGDTSIALPEPITRKEQFLYQACLNGGAGGCTEITDGIVVKERDADGYATVVDFYGTDIHVAQFYGGSRYSAAEITPFKNLATINTKNAVTSIGSLGLSGLPNLQPQGLDLSHVQELDGLRFDTGANAETFPVHCPACTKLANDGCKGSGITSAELPELTEIGNSAFSDCKRVKLISIPKITELGQYKSMIFKGCVLLENVEVGSVGYPVISWGSNNFDGCTQSGLVVTLYTTGEKVDALNANVRYGATNATIIIKAADDTTYNGAAYAAGDTILTSTPEVST